MRAGFELLALLAQDYNLTLSLNPQTISHTKAELLTALKWVKYLFTSRFDVRQRG